MRVNLKYIKRAVRNKYRRDKESQNIVKSLSLSVIALYSTVPLEVTNIETSSNNSNIKPLSSCLGSAVQQSMSTVHVPISLYSHYS